MRRSPRTPRTRAIASCEVIPAGLSARRTPSIGRLLVRQGAVADLTQQGLDASRLGDGVVEPELDLRRESEPKRATDVGAEVPRHVIEALERFGAFFIRPQHADENACAAEVARHVDTGDG